MTNRKEKIFSPSYRGVIKGFIFGVVVLGLQYLFGFFGSSEKASNFLFFMIAFLLLLSSWLIIFYSKIIIIDPLKVTIIHSFTRRKHVIEYREIVSIKEFRHSIRAGGEKLVISTLDNKVNIYCNFVRDYEEMKDLVCGYKAEVSKLNHG